jgi:hypothetical protein
VVILTWDCFASGDISAEDIASAKQQAILCDKIFEIMRNSIEIMDEVDIILHPLKSELNWPLGRYEFIRIWSILLDLGNHAHNFSSFLFINGFSRY